jgi:hypothetical protein
MQTDWVTGVLTPGPLWPAGQRLYDTGRVFVVRPDGEVERQHANAVHVEGSHDGRLRVWSPDGATLWLSGNPAKFFQGHNLFGSVDHAGLFLRGGIAVREAEGLFPSAGTAESLFEPPRWTRLDLTRSYRFADDGQARAWLRVVASTARSRHGAAVAREGTVYWGKTSTRWAFKVYLKSDELDTRVKGHKLSGLFAAGDRRQLREWAAGVVRFELTLRSPELRKLGLERAGTMDALAVWSDYWRRIVTNRNVDVAEGEEMDMVDDVALTPALAGYLMRWRFGEDLRRRLPHNTYYRTRRALLDAVGVDIASPPVKLAQVGEACAAVSAALDPARWDPEPITSHLYEPDQDGDLKRSYRLL